MASASRTIPLFKRYPQLQGKLPYVALGKLPTAVQKLHRLGKDIGTDHLYIKRDDLTGESYGGNKIRKLEFLLGQALRSGVKEVLTFGAAGSNHCLATAIYARQVGLRSISILVPQPNAHYVRRNLLMSHYYQAELYLYRNRLFVALGMVCQLLQHKAKYGYFPQIIPMGGSSPIGISGFVNAALELAEQIRNGEIPEPDRIYVPMGTMGTAVGLMLGLKVAGLKSQVIGVRVIDETIANKRRLSQLFSKTSTFLHSLDPSFPKLELSSNDAYCRGDFFGNQYALFTKEGMAAVTRMEQNEDIKLEGTYTGKAFAALISDVEKYNLRDRVILFWNTHNSRDLSDAIKTVDYHQLPRCFHRYFEEDVQPLDRRTWDNPK